MAKVHTVVALDTKDLLDALQTAGKAAVGNSQTGGSTVKLFQNGKEIKPDDITVEVHFHK